VPQHGLAHVPSGPRAPPPPPLPRYCGRKLEMFTFSSDVHICAAVHMRMIPCGFMPRENLPLCRMCAVGRPSWRPSRKLNQT
jgi:hypothetical protein